MSRIRRVAVAATLCGLCLIGLPSLGAGSASPAPAPATSAPVVQSMAAADPAELQERLKALEEQQRAGYAALIEGQRKSIDWWISMLGVMTAVIGIAGALLPVLFSLNLRAAARGELEEVRRIREEMSRTRQAASQDAEAISQRLREFREQPERPGSPSDDADVMDAARQAVASLETSSADRLRASAIQLAHSSRRADAVEEIYNTWMAVLSLDPSDASATFNAGYFAQELYDHGPATSRQHWFGRVERHYAEALALQPTLHWAANNWGLALAREAAAKAYADLAEAQTLWRRAGEKYEQALSLKRDLHEAANSWGNALADEARAVAEQDPSAACSLWRRAGLKFEQALAIKPDKHEAADNWAGSLLNMARRQPQHRAELLEQALSLLTKHSEAAPGVVAYNLACVHAMRQDWAASLNWLTQARAHGALPSRSHVDADPDLAGLRAQPNYPAWAVQTWPPTP